MDVENIRNQYLAMVPVNNIAWELPHSSDKSAQKVAFAFEDQSNIFLEVCCHHINAKYPPSRNYQKEFLKRLIFQAEENGHEVIDEIYGLFTKLVSSCGGDACSNCYKSYCVGSSYVTLRESVNMISRGTTGLITWQASLGFVEWMISSEMVNSFSGKRVLELGCGIGFAGISICQLCKPTKYVFSDCHEAVLERLRENIDLNLTDYRGQTEVKLLDWTTQKPLEEWLAREGVAPLDFVVATDVVYDPDICRTLVLALETVMRYHPAVTVFVSSTVRNTDTYRHFTDTLATKKISSTRMDTGRHLPFLFYDRTYPVEILQITMST